VLYTITFTKLSPAVTKGVMSRVHDGALCKKAEPKILDIRTRFFFVFPHFPLKGLIPFKIKNSWDGGTSIPRKMFLVQY